MKLIESKAEYIPQEEGLEGIYKQIELAGRTCYRSEDKITPDSAKGFVDRMIASKHLAMLEHGAIYLRIPVDYIEKHEGNNYAGGTRIEFVEKCPYYNNNFYSKSQLIHINSNMVYPDVPYGYNFKGGVMYQIVTTNYRVLIENNWLDDLQYFCSPTEFHEKRYTMRFTCSRGISHELVRHRTMSFAQESQRYVNYSKEKHGGEITFIIPSWLPEIGESRVNTMLEEINVREDIEDDKKSWVASCLLGACIDTERMYFEALENGATPQQARDVLPNATKTEIIMTGFSSDWARLFELRLYESTGKVAPDMKVLMQKAWKEFENYGITRDLERYIKL